MKTVKITPPEGYEIDREKSTLDQIVFKEVSPVAKSWKELKEVGGYYIDDSASISSIGTTSTIPDNRNVFKTKEQAEAVLALAQLSQLIAAVNGDWKPIVGKHRWAIAETDDTTDVELWSSYLPTFIVFKTKKIAEEFLKNHRELLKTARMFI